MAGVNDYGSLDIDPLADPKLGGTDGWAAAVAAALNNSDVTVDARVAAAKEVYVGTSQPSNPNVLLWIDEAGVYPP